MSVLTKASDNLRGFLPRNSSDWIILAILTVAVVLFLLPVYVMVITGLKSPQNVSLSTMWQPPQSLSAGGFAEAWARLRPNMMNSFAIVIPATVISSLVGSLNGYLFSKWRFRGSNVVFTLLVFGMFIPYQSILIPLVRFLTIIGLYGTIPGLVLVHVVYGLPITTLIFRNFYVGIPNDILEAARVDGAGVIGVFWRIMLPLSLPAFVVSGIFQFTNVWNDFLFGVVVVPNPAAQPVTVALQNLSGTFSVDWNVVMAGAVVAAIPTALVYILLGKWFIRGLTTGYGK